MPATLHIGTDGKGSKFTLPLDFVTQTAAILARKRVGKTYTASVIAEELCAAQQPFVVLDPTGAWWGLRSHYPVIIIGGAHGDVPLESTAGKVIADLVVDHPGIYVIDLSQTLSNAEQDRFATDFAERLYRAKEKHRFPLHLFVDEADSFAPQRPMPGQQRMLGAFEAIVRRGGIRGLGMTLITQRPAVLNKNVLTQCEMLVVLQMGAPQDQDAIGDWVGRNGTKEESRTMIGSLASLQRGEAWLWSPSWLQTFQKIKIRTRRTFNSSATPVPGEAIHLGATAMAKVDLAKLGKQIAETVERAKDNDPSALRSRIRQLELEVSKKTPAIAPEPPVEVKIPDCVALNALNDRLNELNLTIAEVSEPLKAQLDHLERIRGEIGMTAAVITRELSSCSSSPKPSIRIPAVVSLPDRKPKPVIHPTPPNGAVGKGPMTSFASSGKSSLPKAEKLILTCLAQFGACTKNKVAAIAGYAVSGGGFNNSLGALRSNGFITVSDPIEITPEGVHALGPFTPLPTGPALISDWERRLAKAEAAIFRVVCDKFPNQCTKEEIAAATGYEVHGGGFNNALGRLRTLELINRGASIRANENLFS